MCFLTYKGASRTDGFCGVQVFRGTLSYLREIPEGREGAELLSIDLRNPRVGAWNDRCNRITLTGDRATFLSRHQIG